MNAFRQRIGCTDTATGGHIGLEVGFDAEDPLVLHFVFDDRGDPVEWLIGRDLVWEAAGCGRGVGDRAIRLWPHDYASTCLWLAADDGSSNEFLLPTRPLLRFVCRTFSAVPRGREQDVVDAAIDSMLREVAL